MRKEPRPEDIELGNRIRLVRETIAKKNQIEFAERLGLSRGSVVNWERGHGAGRASLEKIAVAYGVNYDWLATARGDPQGEPAAKPEPAPASRVKIERLWELFDKARKAGEETQIQIIALLESVLDAESQAKDADRKSRTITTKHAS